MEEALKYFDSLNFYYHKVARTNLNDKDIVKFDQEQLVYVKVAFIALNFMCRKEEIIENKGNVEYELLVNNYELNKELNKIAERNNNGYIIGQIQFKDAAEVICYIRNKFAHGDYIINIYNNSVIMKKDGQNMEINIDKLINFIMPLSNLLDKIKNDKIYKRNLIGMPSPKNVGVIKNKEEYNNLLNKTNIFSLTFTKKNDDIFNQSEKIFIEQYISLIKNAVTNEKLYNSDALEKNFNENQSFARMKIEKHKINALEENSILEKLYDGNKKEFDEIELIPQMNQIAEWIDEIVVDDSMKNNLLSRGCLINSICCGSFKNGIISIKNCRQEYKNLTKFPLSNEETKRISALLAMFYAIYIYPNEHKYMNNFAYDKLNLDFLKPDTLEYKNVKLEQLKMRLSGLNKSRNKTEEKCDKIKSYVNGIINSNKLTDDDRKIKLKQFKNELSVISNQKLEIDNLIVKMEKEYDDLLNQWNTNKKFYLNKAIIEHIRDAIAHGNIKIQKTGQNGKENLLFIDDHKGKICLDLIVAIEDFENLFSEENINALREETVQKNKRY